MTAVEGERRRRRRIEEERRRQQGFPGAAPAPSGGDSGRLAGPSAPSADPYSAYREAPPTAVHPVSPQPASPAGQAPPTAAWTTPPVAPAASRLDALPGRRRRQRRRQRAASDVVTVLLAVAMPVMVWADLPVPGRSLVTVAFALLLPGLPSTWLLRLPSTLAIAVLVVATSLATTLVASEILLAAGLPGARTWVTVVSVLSVVLVGVRHALPPPQDADPPPTSDQHDEGAYDARSLLTGAALVLGLGFFVWGLAGTDLNRMTGAGLISVMPVQIPIALILLAAAAASELTRPVLQEVWLGVVASTFVFVLFGYQVFGEKAASLPVAWFHVGFVSWIQVHGEVLGGFDARFSWPGFFAAGANLTLAAGQHDASWLLRFAPIAYNLLWGPPLLLVARSLCSSKRVSWLALLLFYCGNWYQQDYFSPQATAMILHLSLFGVLMWLTSSSDGVPERFNPFAVVANWRWRPPVLDGVSVTAVSALAGICWLLVVGIVVSHQLTPVLLIVGLLVARAFGRLRYPNLWLATGVAFVGWIAYGATDFWTGHLNQILGDVGKVSSTVNSGVAARIVGDPAHLRMQYVRIGLCLAFTGLGLIGLLINRRRRGHWVLAGLAYSPFSLVVLQSYGGEVLLRVFLFAMPGLAILSAEALRVLLVGRRFAAGALAAVLAVTGVWLVAARGANEGFERITPTQLLAAQFVVRAAGTQDGIVTFNDFTPLDPLFPNGAEGRPGPQDVRVRKVVSVLADPSCDTLSAAACVQRFDPRFVYATTSQAAFGWQVGGRPHDWMPTTMTSLVTSKKYRVVFSAPDAVVLARADVTVRAAT